MRYFKDNCVQRMTSAKVGGGRVSSLPTWQVLSIFHMPCLCQEMVPIFPGTRTGTGKVGVVKNITIMSSSVLSVMLIFATCFYNFHGFYLKIQIINDCYPLSLCNFSTISLDVSSFLV